MIDFSISNVLCANFIHYWRVKEYRKLFKNNYNDLTFTRKGNQEYDRLSLYQMQSAFYFFLILNFISMILFLIELIKKLKLSSNLSNIVLCFRQI